MSTFLLWASQGHSSISCNERHVWTSDSAATESGSEIREDRKCRLRASGEAGASVCPAGPWLGFGGGGGKESLAHRTVWKANDPISWWPWHRSNKGERRQRWFWKRSQQRQRGGLEKGQGWPGNVESILEHQTLGTPRCSAKWGLKHRAWGCPWRQG